MPPSAWTFELRPSCSSARWEAVSHVRVALSGACGQGLLWLSRESRVGSVLSREEGREDPAGTPLASPKRLWV